MAEIPLKPVVDRGALDRATNEIKDSFDRLGDEITKIKKLNIFSAFAGAKEVLRTIGDMIGAVADLAKESAEAEAIERRAAAALKLRGDAYGSALERLKAFNSELQSKLGIDADNLLQLQGTLASLGVLPDKLEDATKATIGLSEATGRGLQQSARAVTQALRGNVEMLEKYGIRANDASDATERLKQLFAIAEEQAAGSQGAIDRMTTAWGDLREEIGGAFLDVDRAGGFMTTLTGIVKSTTGALNDLREALKERFEGPAPPPVEEKLPLGPITGSGVSVPLFVGGMPGELPTEQELEKIQRRIEDERERKAREAAEEARRNAEYQRHIMDQALDEFESSEQRLESELKAATQRRERITADFERSESMVRQRGIRERATENELNFQIRQEIFDREVELNNLSITEQRRLWSELTKLDQDGLLNRAKITQHHEKQNEEFNKNLVAFADIGKNVMTGFGEAIGAGMAQTISNLIMGGDGIKRSVGEIVGTLVVGLGTMLIQTGTAALVLGALSLIPGVQLVTGPPGAAIAGGALAIGVGAGMVALGKAMGAGESKGAAAGGARGGSSGGSSLGSRSSAASTEVAPAAPAQITRIYNINLSGFVAGSPASVGREIRRYIAASDRLGG